MCVYVCVCVCVCVCVFDYAHLACVRMSMYSEYSCLYVLHVCLSHTMLIYIVLCRNLIHRKYSVLYAYAKNLT